MDGINRAENGQELISFRQELQHFEHYGTNRIFELQRIFHDFACYEEVRLMVTFDLKLTIVILSTLISVRT